MLKNSKKEREFLERTLAIQEVNYGSGHLQVAKTLNNLGDVNGPLGEHVKQRELLERELAIQKHSYGPHHPDVAISLTNLGNACQSIDEYVKQRELLEGALAINEQQFGPDHPSVAVTLTSLGVAYRDLGQYDKARELLERALPINEKHYGPDHPEMAITLTNLGAAYRDVGQYDKARELLERALPIKEKHYGPDHLGVAITLTSLGNTYRDLGQHIKARELLERALPIMEKHYDPDHIGVAITLTNLGVAHRYLGQYDKARELLERALPIKEKHYGPDHPYVAITLNSLGAAYRDSGQYDKEREMLRCATEIKENHYGSNLLLIAPTLSSVGNANETPEEYGKQCKVRDGALVINGQHSGTDFPQVYGNGDMDFKSFLQNQGNESTKKRLRSTQKISNRLEVPKKKHELNSHLSSGYLETVCVNGAFWQPSSQTVLGREICDVTVEGKDDRSEQLLQNLVNRVIVMENHDTWRWVVNEKCREVLVQDLNGLVCAENLRSQSLINASENGLIKSEKTPPAIVNKLLDILITKDKFWVPLLQFLEESNQIHLKDQLVDEYRKRETEYRKLENEQIVDSIQDLPNGWCQVGKIKYNPPEELGRGSEGIVYKGTFDERPVAVKQINKDYKNLDREVKLLRISDSRPHENVVKYIFVEKGRQFRYIAMELCDKTLEKYVESNTLLSDSHHLVNLLKQIASGLCHLHELSIVHRDIKPQNVLISETRLGQVRALITDFGLSKSQGPGQLSIAMTTGFSGTVGWMAPEIFHGKSGSYKVDIFSMGCLFYFTMTKGSHPFDDVQSSNVQMNAVLRPANILHGKYSLNQLNSDDKCLAKHLVENMISKNPGERPSAETVLKHPFFYSAEKQLLFFQDVSYRVKNNSLICKSLELDREEIAGLDWRQHMCETLIQHLDDGPLSRRKYEGNSICDLLRAIRHIKHYYEELPEEVRSALGSTQEGLAHYFTSRFPRLLLHTYLQSQEHCRDKETFWNYYSSTYSWKFELKGSCAGE